MCVFDGENMKKIKIYTDYITLGQFLKIADVIQSGGEAKGYLACNEVFINDELDVRRGRKLREGDKVVVEGQEFIIEHENQ
jgi:S4 domain protein YaaA